MPASYVVGSVSVYGVSGDDVATEESPTDPLTPYARSKCLTEEGLTGLADDDFTVTCLRFATACGMSDRLRLDLVLNDFVGPRSRRARSRFSATALRGGR